MNTKSNQSLSDEADRLVAANKWSEKEFRRIYTEAIKIDDDPESLEFLYMLAEPKWLDRIGA